MPASNVVVIYNVAAMVLTPGKALRRIIVCDNDAQVSNPNGPCKLESGEASILIPVATYSAFGTLDDILSYVLTHL